MQNFKIKRAPWKDNEVNSMSRKEKGRGPRRVSLCPVHYASIPFSKEKEVHEKCFKFYCKLLQSFIEANCR